MEASIHLKGRKMYCRLLKQEENLFVFYVSGSEQFDSLLRMFLDKCQVDVLLDCLNSTESVEKGKFGKVRSTGE